MAMLAQRSDLARLPDKGEFSAFQSRMELLLGESLKAVVNELKGLRQDLKAMVGKQPVFLTVDEFHELLGGAICAKTIRNMCNDGRLPATKQGNRWLIPSAIVEEWIERNCY